MFIRRSHFGVVVAALLLSGCSFLDNTADSVWSSLSGEDSDTSSKPPSDNDKDNGGGGAGTVVAIPPSNAESNPQPTLTQQPLAGAYATPLTTPGSPTGNFATPLTTPGSPTGTYVGAKVVALRGDLQRLQDNISHQNSDLQQLRQQIGQDAGSYHTLVGAINSRLQTGTTPGNPELINQWNQAQGALDRLSDEIARLNSLSNVVAGDSSVATYLLDSVRAAYSLQGAVDEDHRQLRQLESDVNATIPQIDRLLASLSDDINRQSVYVANERQSLVSLSLAIKDGELYGRGNNIRTPTAPPRARTGGAISTLERRPLVVIRFDRADVAYEPALRTAVTQALNRRPAASFDLVAVTPNAGSPAQVEIHAAACKRNAENVLRAMTNMGVSPSRVSLSSTTSASVQSNEVQIYVR